MLAGFLCIQCYGRQQCHTLLDQSASNRWPTHTETEGHCFACSDASTGEIHLASCELKENYERDREMKDFLFSFLVIFWGKPSFPWHS